MGLLRYLLQLKQSLLFPLSDCFFFHSEVDAKSTLTSQDAFCRSSPQSMPPLEADTQP